jgi:Peptidase family M28
MKLKKEIDERRLRRDWEVLCAEIGERRAGTDNERRAAAYIGTQFVAAGLTDVHEEEFPCTSLRRAKPTVRARDGSRWRSVPAVTLVGAPGTPGGRVVEGEMVWLEMPESAGQLAQDSLCASVTVIFGPLPTVEAHHRALVAAAPLAVIHVDDRLPFDWAKSDGVYPEWVRRHGMPTTVTVPYPTAWAWRRTGVKRARVRVRIEQVAALSQNVIGVLPGREPQLPEIVVSAHHDTQCGNPGADDNASGVGCVLALARLFAAKSHRRTLRFISFGTEEQLSVGAAAYVQRHRTQMKDVGLVVNFDRVASPLGHFKLWCVGPDALARHSTRALARNGLDVRLKTEVTPFVDNFPFNAAGVPSWWLFRPNFPSGRWQYPSPHDTLENVSVSEVGRLLRAVAPVVGDLAGMARWPFLRRLPAAQRIAARRLGRELFALEA